MISSSILLLLTAAFMSRGLHSQLEPRIIGGRDMNIEEVPWQVSLQMNGLHYCGGSLFSDRIVITAALCFYFGYERPPRLRHTRQILIIAGSELKRYGKYASAVSEKRHHEKYNYSTNEHDIGVMLLRKPFPFSNQIRPIKLAMKDPALGSWALLTGWGQINSAGPDTEPENLQGLNVFIKEKWWCKKYGNTPNHTICAGYSGIPNSGCHWDYGGPLVFAKELVGVISAVNSNCFGPPIYTSIAEHHVWLTDAIKSISRRKVRSGNGKIKRAQKLSWLA